MMLRTTNCFELRPTTRAKSFGGRSENRAALLDDVASELRTVSLKVVELAYKLSNYATQTPAQDGLAALRVLAQSPWFEQLMSGQSPFPYIVDIYGKAPAYADAVRRLIIMAQQSEKLAQQVIPGIRNLKSAFWLLPSQVNGPVDHMRDMIHNFLNARGQGKVISRLPDISQHFKFQHYVRLDKEHKEGHGWLGIPGKVKQHRSFTAQKAISAGTGDDAGHLIGNRFGAPGTAENLGMQNWKANRTGTFRDLEDHWERRLLAGFAVHVHVVDITRPNEARPFVRRVNWTEVTPDGTPSNKTTDFANPHTPESRLAQGIESTNEAAKSANVIYVDFVNRRRLG